MSSRYLADKSALARLHQPPVRDVLAPLIHSRALATCSVLDLEVLFSARTHDEYVRERRLRRAVFAMLEIDQVVCDRAVEVQAALAARGQHRAASLPDLLIAACAEHHGVSVLHYDGDFDLIAEVTGQQVTWVVPRGSVP